MANKDLLVGSAVKLSPDHKWARTSSNPLNTVGIIDGNIDDTMVGVAWSNGRYNSYSLKDSDLILIESP